jgi:foldase protein PrsA
MNTKRAKIIHEGKHKKITAHKTKIFTITAIILGILLIVAIVSGGTFFIPSNSQSKTSENATVLVLVNGEAILQQDIDAQWNALPPETKIGISKEQLLEEMVSETLLLQRARELNITMPLEEVELSVSMQLAQYGTTLEDYKKLVAEQGVNYDDIILMYQRQLIIAKLFEEETSTQDLEVSEEDIQTYYLEHSNEFIQEEKVQVRHILSAFSDEVNESNALAQSEELLAQIINDETVFCDLVTQYSMDSGSVANCGEYTFGKGVMVEEFENASFSMNIGDYEIVKTNYGYHIINKLKNVPAGILTLDDEIAELPGMLVRDVVYQMLLEQKARTIFDTYISQLESEATVEYSS